MGCARGGSIGVSGFKAGSEITSSNGSSSNNSCRTLAFDESSIDSTRERRSSSSSCTSSNCESCTTISSLSVGSSIWAEPSSPGNSSSSHQRNASSSFRASSMVARGSLTDPASVSFPVSETAPRAPDTSSVSSRSNSRVSTETAVQSWSVSTAAGFCTSSPGTLISSVDVGSMASSASTESSASGCPGNSGAAADSSSKRWSTPANTARQAPQRTRPWAICNCDSPTRNRVWQLGHSVISGGGSTTLTPALSGLPDTPNPLVE